jgi:flagellar M-ring protein FliF
MAANNLDSYNRNNRDNKGNNNMKNLFSSMTMAQKISIVLIAIIVLVGLFMVYKWNSQPEYVALYSSLTPENAASIVSKLDEAKIKYKVSSDSTAIQVDQKQISQARLLLAEQGLPVDSTVGFELFDKQFFGLTDFTQKINYQRALEGELSKTIAGIEEIESVRVHLVLPQSEIFSEKQSNASASIVLKMKNGIELKSGSVRAITNLVAGSVEGLSKENIIIADTKGNLLSSGGEESAGISEHQNLIAEFENQIGKDLSFMLAMVYGNENVIVRVNADIDFDKKVSETETYLPEGDGKGVILSETLSSESYDKNTGDISSVTNSTAAGTDANVPNVDATATTTSSSYGEKTDTGTQDNNYLKDETLKQYAISKKSETINSQGGSLQKLTIGIFVNKNLPKEEMNEIKSVVAAAAGIDESRGDSLSIEGINFAAVKEELASNAALPSVVPIKDQLTMLLQKYFPGILLIIVLGLLTFRSFKNKNPKQKGIKHLNYYPGTITDNQSDISSSSGINEPVYFGAKETPVQDLKDKKKMNPQKFNIKNTAKQNVEERKENENKAARVEEDYIPPEHMMGKFTKLRELVGEGVTGSPDLARKIIKNWVSEGK